MGKVGLTRGLWWSGDDIMPTQLLTQRRARERLNEGAEVTGLASRAFRASPSQREHPEEAPTLHLRLEP